MSERQFVKLFILVQLSIYKGSKMNMKLRAGTVLALLLLLSLASFVAPRAGAEQAPQLRPAFAVYAYWGVNESQVIAYPGAGPLPLSVKVVYLGPVDAYNVTFKVVPSWPLEPARGEGAVTAYIPVMAPGDSLTLVGLYNVSANASIGVYNETLKVSFLVGEFVPQLNKTVYVSASYNLSFSVPVLGYQDIKVAGFRTEPPVIYAGQNATLLVVYLVNDGTVPARDVTVTLHPSWPLSPLYNGSSKVVIGYMPPGLVINVTFPLKIYNVSKVVRLLAPSLSIYVPSPTNATVTLTVTTSSGETFNYSIPITVEPSAYFSVVGVSPSELRSGESDVPVTVTLINVGESEAKYLMVTLLPNPVLTPYISSSENPVIAMTIYNYSVGDVSPLGEFNVTYPLSVASNLGGGTYYINLLLTWYQPPTMQPMHEVISVPIKIGPSYVLRISLGSLASSSNLALLIIAVVVVVILIIMAVVGSRR